MYIKNQVFRSKTELNPYEDCTLPPNIDTIPGFLLIFQENYVEILSDEEEEEEEVLPVGQCLRKI